MGHPESLIESIINKVKIKYPEKEYKYLIESRLFNDKKLIFPDIQILKDGNLHCVIEIGYTRPEKLKYYNHKKIPDIKWYSKDGDEYNHVNVVKTIENIIKPINEIYYLNEYKHNQICLDNCEFIVGEYCDDCEFACKISDCNNDCDCCLFGINEGKKCDEVPCSKVDILLSEHIYDTHETLIYANNGKVAFLTWYCDICGQRYIAETSDEIEEYLICLNRMEYQQLRNDHFKIPKEDRKQFNSSDELETLLNREIDFDLSMLKNIYLLDVVNIGDC